MGLSVPLILLVVAVTELLEIGSTASDDFHKLEPKYTIERNDGSWDDPPGHAASGGREAQSPGRGIIPSGQSGAETGSRQSSGRNDGSIRQSADQERSNNVPNRTNRPSGTSRGSSSSNRSSGRNEGSVRQSSDQGRPTNTGSRSNGPSGAPRGLSGSTQSSGRNEESVRQSADQGESNLPSSRQNSTSSLPGREESDEDLESRRLSGAAKRFINSSTKLVEDVLPGNIGKILPKVVDDSNDEVCYDRVGCFTNRDLLTLPSSFPIEPEKVNTMFLLYSRSNRQNPITVENKGSSREGRVNQFRQPKPLKILVHGFNEDGNATWARNVKDALLAEEHCNVIIVDWEGGAKTLNYIKAAGNTALVGREISLLLQRLIKSHQGALRPADIHLIGFSLGGQAVGFAGRHFQKDTRSLIGRITALDPAGPLFDDTEVSVSSKDAEYVDAIHTSGGEKIISGQLGIDRPVGHVDFYPNGGKKQPGCPPLDLTCDHNRATLFFLESIKNKRCRFVSSPCQGGFSAFLDNKCVQRGERGEMGYFSPRARGRGIQVLTTNKQSEFCVGSA
ncbi:unnamed protein product [Ixodes persulcatus]